MFWDPRSPTPLFKLTASDARFALDGGITALAVNGASTLAVAGGVTGGVRVVGLTSHGGGGGGGGDVVGALDGHAQGESIEAVACVDLAGAGGTAGVIVTAGTDGKACVWDLSTMRLRCTMEHEVNFHALCLHFY